jgi:hypothetical protein
MTRVQIPATAPFNYSDFQNANGVNYLQSDNRICQSILLSLRKISEEEQVGNPEAV